MGGCPVWKPCPTCGGGGQVALGEHFVTRDMAIDGGDREMEGMSMGVEYGSCPDCGGSGTQLQEKCNVTGCKNAATHPLSIVDQLPLGLGGAMTLDRSINVCDDHDEKNLVSINGDVRPGKPRD